MESVQVEDPRPNGSFWNDAPRSPAPAGRGIKAKFAEALSGADNVAY